MKKFFAAVCCCAVVSLNVSSNVSAQEIAPIDGDVVLAEAQSVVEASDSESILVSAFQDESPAPADVPAVEEISDEMVEGRPVESEIVVADGTVLEGYAPGELSLGEYSDPTFAAAAPLADAGCGCGQSAPAMSYDAGISYDAAVSDNGCGCDTAAPVADCGCETARARPQVISRFRGGLTSARGRVGSVRGRRNACCN